MSTAGHNWLTAIAADIRALHAGIRRNAEQIARDAIEAGKLLIEAKQSLPHGEWEAWLRDHVTISPRTARRYMRIASSGLEIGHVADLGLTAAAKALAPGEALIERIHTAKRIFAETLVEIGRELGAALDEIGEAQFLACAPAETGIRADEALFLIEAAHVIDTGGDVAALLARDDAPKEFHIGSWRPSP